MGIDFRCLGYRSDLSSFWGPLHAAAIKPHRKSRLSPHLTVKNWLGIRDSVKPIPQRHSLVTQTEAILLERIREKYWVEELPGERSLIKELKVSRWTLRAALTKLASNGIIKISHGRACQIVLKTQKRTLQQAQVRHVVMLSPCPLSRQRLFVALWVDELRDILSHWNIELTIVQSAMAFRNRPAATLKKLLHRFTNHAWILLLSTEAIQQWFQQNVRFACIAGTRFKGITLPAVDVASHAIGVHIGHTLLGLGHRRIAYFHPHKPNAGNIATEQGIAEAIRKSQFSSETQLIVRECEANVTSTCHAVDRVLAGTSKPTVFVGARASFILTAFTHLVQCGWRVPQDFSLVSVEWEPYLELAVPKIAHYIISPAQFASKLARVLNGIGPNPKPFYITPQFIRGGSLRACLKITDSKSG